MEHDRRDATDDGRRPDEPARADAATPARADAPGDPDRFEFPRQSPWHQPPIARPSAGRPASDDGAPGSATGRVRTASGPVRWSRRRIGVTGPIPEPESFPPPESSTAPSPPPPPAPAQRRPEPPARAPWTPPAGAAWAPPPPPAPAPPAPDLDPVPEPPPVYVPPGSVYRPPSSPVPDLPTDRLGSVVDGDQQPYGRTAPAFPSIVDGQPMVHPYQDLEIDLSYPVPTADDLTARRTVRPREWVATTGVRAAARRGTFGLVRLSPNRRERDHRAHIAAVRRAFGGLRQITVVNPKGGAGKTVATLMLGLTFGQSRGGFVLAWDNNETQGTLGMRAQVDGHSRTVRDLLRDLHRFGGTEARIGELSAYVRAQQGAAFDVLASDESATAGEMLTATAFREIRAVVGRFYRLLLVDTGNNARADNWQAALDATDQLVIALSARNDSAETAARLLDHLEQTGRRELVRRSVAVLSMAPHRADLDPRAIERHFSLRCRAVLRVPYDRHLDEGGPVDFTAVAPESRRAWLRVAATVADGL